MVGEIRSDHESEWAAMIQVAQLLGVGTPETIRKWCRQAEVDAGRRPGTMSDESVELKRLKRENAELKRANAILRSVLRLSSRPNSTGHCVDRAVHRLGRRQPRRGRSAMGVESICAQLTELDARIAPSTYYEHRGRPPTAREVRNADLKPKVAQAYVENYGVYGAR